MRNPALSTDAAYDAAVRYAADLGSQHGANAAFWYAQDIDKSSTGLWPQDNETQAWARILRGIEDGDPAVLDTFPAPDLSGEWAGTMTGPDLVSDALEAAGDLPAADPETGEPSPESVYWFSDICDAYETAFSTAVEAAIAAAARAILA